VHRYTAAFKAYVCLYHVAQGGKLATAADASGISDSLLCIWRARFTKGIIRVFSAKYLPAPTPQSIRASLDAFQARRGIANCTNAVDGTHVPYSPPLAEVRSCLRPCEALV
jgi:hypothetical protein